MKRTNERVTAALEAAAPDLLRFLVRRTASAADAADLLGEVALVAWRRRGSAPQIPDEVRLWLFGIARNAVLNHWRASRRATRLAAELRSVVAVQAAVPDHADATEQTDLVQRLLAGIPDNDAELVRLLHWDSLTIGEAAQLLEIPASTARSRYAKAKERLRAQLATASEYRPTDASRVQ